MATTHGTNRNTEITDPANGLLVDYNQAAHSGAINIPCGLGDMWQLDQVGYSAPNLNGPPAYNTRNLLIHALPPNWTNIDVTFTFSADTDTQQAGVALYQDDDNFVLNSLGFSNIRFSHPDTNTVPWTYDTSPGPREFCVWEYGGILPTSPFANESPHAHNYNWESSTFAHTLRWSRDPITGLCQAYWSPNPDLMPWADVGDPTQATGQAEPPRLSNMRLAIWTGCTAPATAGAVNLVLSNVVVISIEPAVVLTYSLLNPPSGAAIDANGIITWTPALGQFPSTNVFKTVVTDNSAPPVSATNSFTVVVQDINAAPVLPPQPDRTM